MHSQYDHTYRELLKSACSSIRYRVRKEIFHEPIDSQVMGDLQAEIQQDAAVQDITASQQPDGWIGRSFHGYDSLEAAIRLLLEKGVNPNHPVLARALKAMEDSPEKIALELGIVGKVFDERGLGGSSMMQAALLAQAGLEDKPLVREQIESAIEGFHAVCSASSVGDVVEQYRDHLVFKPGVKWPSIYHLRLLAFSSNWRTPETREMLGRSVKRLAELSPLPAMYARYRSQIIAPASFAMQDFNPVMENMRAPEWMSWFHRMELLSRLGVIAAVPELNRQAETLRGMLREGEGWFTRRLSHAYFRRWGAYAGLASERDWIDPKRRIYDLTFRSLLVLNFTGVDL